MSAVPVPAPTKGIRRMLFGERTFGLFFLFWGCLLQLDNFIPLSTTGILLFELKCYAPSWLWGGVMIVIGIGRYIAYRAHSKPWRLALSSATIIVLWLIAFIALWARLIGATFPLACFVAMLAQGFHKMLARDIELGL